MNRDIKFKIIDLLKTKRAYSKSVNGKQHYTRCPYCGDSRNLSHAHLSIKIDVESDDPMVFRCLKCDTRGLLTETVLEELDILVERDMINELKSYNKKSMRYGKIVNLDTEKFTVPLYYENSLNSQKLDYINSRLGLDLSYTDARDKKILLNLFDFMKFNDIEKIDGLYYSMMKVLNNNYVGFLSSNNNCIVFRDITGNQKYRYFKVILNPKNLNPDTFYSVPSSIPLLYTHDINVHLTEGIFDILSVQENLIRDNSVNFFYATCGFGGITILKYLLHHGINTGVNLHIYSDNDKTDWNHKKYLYDGSYITEWIDHIYIHRNKYENEKDYGVRLENIKDTYSTIK